VAQQSVLSVRLILLHGSQRFLVLYLLRDRISLAGLMASLHEATLLLSFGLM
jgi:hypothetical protein